MHIIISSFPSFLFEVFQMLLSFALISADPSTFLGRLDHASLSQQTLMEMLVDGLKSPESLYGKSTPIRDISEWHGVTMNETDEVVRISWIFGKVLLGGSIHLQWLPASIQVVEITNQHLMGSMDLTELPPQIKQVWLFMNGFTGEIYLSTLPQGIEEIDVSFNQLSGGLQLDHLPSSLVDLKLDTNLFTGTVNLTKLPSEMKTLGISYNNLSGIVDLTQLPEGLTSLWMNNNNFEGITDFSKLPTTLERFTLNETKLEGEILLPEETDYIEFNVAKSKVKVTQRAK